MTHKCKDFSEQRAVYRTLKISQGMWACYMFLMNLHLLTWLWLPPVPHLDRLARGWEDGGVLWAEGERAGVGAVAAQCQAWGLGGGGHRVAGPEWVGFHCVVLQQQCQPEVSTGQRQTVYWPENHTEGVPQIIPMHKYSSGWYTYCMSQRGK